MMYLTFDSTFIRIIVFYVASFLPFSCASHNVDRVKRDSPGTPDAGLVKQFPWLVKYVIHHCNKLYRVGTGTLVTENIALTTGRTVYIDDAEPGVNKSCIDLKVQVVYNSEERPVKNTYIHPCYCKCKDKVDTYDIALVTLSTEIQFPKEAKKMTLTSVEPLGYLSKDIYVGDWEHSAHHEKHPIYYQAMSSKIESKGIISVVVPSNAPCIGESGGPLVFFHEDGFTLIGVANSLPSVKQQGEYKPQCYEAKNQYFVDLYFHVEWLQMSLVCIPYMTNDPQKTNCGEKESKTWDNCKAIQERERIAGVGMNYRRTTEILTTSGKSRNTCICVFVVFAITVL